MEDIGSSDYEALGRFRHLIRRFLHFSEVAARSEGLEPHQHQIMLAIRACQVAHESQLGPTIGELAEDLYLKHHSAVGLVDRLVERGLAVRARAEDDRRQVRVHLTSEGLEKLRRLANVHREELRAVGPVLVNALTAVLNALPADLPLH